MGSTVVRVAFLGFGSVGRALHALLERRRDALAREHGIVCIVTGVASRSIGWRANAAGFDPSRPTGAACRDIHHWLAESGADVVFEAIALDPHTGQPALDYLRAVLEHGAHAISANKGPLVHGYRELLHLAADCGLQYRFEAAVMDGAPVFSLVRECLPLARLRSVRGVFTSTATVVLEAVEEGRSIDEGIARAQRLGIAEADPSYDVEGWDSAVKLCAVANVLLGGDLRPGDVVREGIRSLTEIAVQQARAEGRPYRLVGEVGRDVAGVIRARVAPMQCSTVDALGVVRGATLVMHYEAEVFPGGLTVTSLDPDPTTTAYGMLADLVSIARTNGRGVLGPE
ncbi:homoserine dehydrogenase [soil metagenome]